MRLGNGSGRLHKAVWSSATSAIYQVCSIICGFILPRMILGAYGSAYNGVVSSITQFFSFFSVLQAGIQGATRVALYKTIANNDNAGTSSIMAANSQYYRRMSYGLVGYIVILSFVFPFMIKDNIDKTDIICLVLIIGLSNFVQYFFGTAYKTIITAHQENYILNIFQTITVIANTLVCSISIMLGYSIIIAKLSSAICYSINPILIYIYANRKYRINKQAKPDNKALKGRWDALANSIANIVHENVDVVFITMFLSAVEVSVYSVYSLVALGMTRIIQVFTNGMEPAFGDIWAKKQIEQLNVNFNKYEYVMYSLAEFLSGCMMVLIIPFVKIYTSGVTDANYIRNLLGFLLSISVFTMSIRMPYVTMVQAAGHYKQTKVGSFTEAMINIVLTLILINVIGIEGAIIGTIVANTFRSIQYGLYTSKNILNRPFSFFIKRLLWSIITLALSVSMSFLITSMIRIDNWVGWIVKACITALINAICLLITSQIFYKRDLNLVIHSFIRK